MKKILVLSANPINTSRLRLDEEVREIQEALKLSNRRNEFEIVSLVALRIDDLRRGLLDHPPSIVHFSGHGESQGLILENDVGQKQLVGTEALAQLFALFPSIECVLLNACYSEIQAEVIHRYVSCVIGMSQTIGDRAAINFAVGFYDALGAGWSYQRCFDMACNAIALAGIPESATPRIKIGQDNEQTNDFVGQKLPCPYKGLAAFRMEDAKFFHGREVFVKELLVATKTRNFIPILGDSGSGKSSVVFAGLVPRLQETDRWIVIEFRPGKEPFHSLAWALMPFYTSSVDSEQLAESRRLSDYLQNGTVLLADVFKRIQENNPQDRVLVIADQFEEIYTLCGDEQVHRNFLDILLAGLESSATWQISPILVATMRVDFYGNVLSYPPFADAFRNSDIKIRSMNRDELKDVIEKPASQMGVDFESGLVDRILDEVENQTGNLPLLEFALTELWKQQAGRLLTHKAYQSITYETTEQSGGFERALASYADDEYQKFSRDDQEQIRRVFVQLVHPGEGQEDTKRLAIQGELGEISWDLVTKLADARLVVTSQNADGQSTVEIVHEALIQHWGSLRQWIEADRVFRAWQEQLRVAMRQWQVHKDEGSLLRGAALIDAEEQLRTRPKALVSESDFIKRSLQERERMQEAEVARRKRETIIVRGTFASLLVIMMLGVGIAATMINSALLYDDFAYCPAEKGRPGKKIKKENPEETVCFRNLITSGEIGIFLSSTNHHLSKGIEAFRKENNKREIKKGKYLVAQIFQRIKLTEKEDYSEAITLFEQAVNADYSDPVPRIFLQNAKARTRSVKMESRGGKSTIIKLAVVTSIDYYEKAANDILRGVFDAQEKFNESQGDDKPLIEIVIANDENEPIAAKTTAQILIENEEVIGVIGHHSSESTKAAQEIYRPKNMPIISSTSSSSKITGEQFFRTVKGTDEAAKKYADHITKKLKINNVAVFYAGGSTYSKDLTSDFKEEFDRPGAEIVDQINIESGFDAKAKIKEIKKEKKSNVILLFTSVKTNSIAIEISKAVYDSNKDNSTKIQILGNMALSEQETIAKGGNYVDGIEVIRPCLLEESGYIKEAFKKWTQNKIAINWRHATSYDAAQAFIQAIKMIDKSDSVQSKEVNRKNILSQLKSTLFSVPGKDTSSEFELKWGSGEDHSNKNAKYCLAKIENGKFRNIDKF